MSASGIPSDCESTNMSQCKETGETDEGVDMNCEAVTSGSMDVVTEQNGRSTENEFSNNAAVQLHGRDVEHFTGLVSKHEAVAADVVDLNNEQITYELEGKVNMAFEHDTETESGDADDADQPGVGVHVETLDRSRSDDHLEIKHQWQAREMVENLKDSPSAISDVNSKDYITMKNFEEHSTPEMQLFAEESSCTESPGITSQDDITYDQGEEEDDADYYIETAGDERMSLIEEEYIDRITLLERRNCDLEMVLHRLTCSVERLLCLSEDGEEEDEDVSEDTENNEAEMENKETVETVNSVSAPSSGKAENLDDISATVESEKFVVDADNAEDDAKVTDEEVAEEDKLSPRDDLTKETTKYVSKHICIELFIEFQKKLAMFAGELKGVLNCSESAIRHGRVVQEWGKSIQLMFEQLLHERKKLMNFIEEREQVMLQSREQFIAEKQEQGRQLQHLVEGMKKYQELMDTIEDHCRDKVVESSQRRSIAESVVELLLQRRLEEERAIILGLTRQSKISEMKLFIMHQQNCIQDLQIQNKELRAVIEGLVGADELDDEQTYDTDQSGTPASVSTPETCSVQQTLDKIGTQPISMLSDVLYCDRGQYLPGMSTDGDLATVQAYGIGKNAGQVDGGENIVFDPLTVDYVREHCQQAEETERRANADAANNTKEEEEDVETEEAPISAESDSEVAALQECVQELNIEPVHTKPEFEKKKMMLNNQEAAGDGLDIVNQKDGTVEDRETTQQTVHAEHMEQALVE